MSEVLKDFVDSTSGLIVLAILAFCTIRDIVAFMGIIPRDTKYIGRIVYGKYAEDLVARALVELGYPRKEAKRKYKSIKKYFSDMEGAITVTEDNAPIQLILLMAKYIKEFKSIIKYGGGTESNYYINTMEIVHDREDSRILCAIMCRLIYSTKINDLDAVFVPKSGNPLLADKLAECLNIPSVFVKNSQEKSKINSENEINADLMNYEGISKVENINRCLKCPIVDCNISGGSQMQKAIELVNMVKPFGIRITEAFILFRVDDGVKDIESVFNNLGVTLYRYFDLDEKIKKEIYQIKKNAESEGRMVDFVNKDDYSRAEDIVKKLKKEKKYYYRQLR